MDNKLDWPIIWQELRGNLADQPPCADHSEYPHVCTLVHGNINDIIQVNEDGVTVRSHKTFGKRAITEKVFKVWWNYLVENGFASLSPGAPNNPRSGDSRVVGAIIAACLPGRVYVLDSKKTIGLIGQRH